MSLDHVHRLTSVKLIGMLYYKTWLLGSFYVFIFEGVKILKNRLENFETEVRHGVPGSYGSIFFIVS